MHTVELERVTKTFGATRAVEDLSLAVPQGSIYGFIGPNGSGKTTTLRLITRILRPDSGAVRVLAEAENHPRSERIGYLPEERGLYKRMRVREALRFYGELKAGRDVRVNVERWLTRLGMADWADKKIEALSKGMGQRVQFAATVVADPALLILDEPFSGLDPVNADLLRDVILELRGQGSTVILSTHDMALAERMCDAICMIFRGRKVLDGTLAAIQDQFGSDTVRVRTADGPAALKGLPDVESVTDFGRDQELRLRRDGDPQRLLRLLAERTSVLRFEIARPSLHDIFVRIVAPREPEVQRA